MTDAIREQLAGEVARLRQIIVDLVNCPHADLEGHVYAIRERELEGWEGPAVTAWSDAVTRAKAVADGR